MRRRKQPLVETVGTLEWWRGADWSEIVDAILLLLENESITRGKAKDLLILSREWSARLACRRVRSASRSGTRHNGGLFPVPEAQGGELSK